MNPEAITAMNHAMGIAGAVACLGLSATGSGFGTGFAGTAACGAWKKCYAQNKPAPFILLGFVGAPLTQTLYGMILMFVMFGRASAGFPILLLGIFSGLAIGVSALFQGRFDIGRSGDAGRERETCRARGGEDVRIRSGCHAERRPRLLRPRPRG